MQIANTKPAIVQTLAGPLRVLFCRQSLLGRAEVGSVRAFQQTTGDDLGLDLSGALEDVQNARVA
jgi:hypothetical protein